MRGRNPLLPIHPGSLFCEVALSEERSCTPTMSHARDGKLPFLIAVIFGAELNVLLRSIGVRLEM
jgi:hypothetical protein